MKILIIGGSGFLSGKLVNQALEKGHQVTIVTRGNKPVSKAVTAIKADRNIPGSLESALSKIKDHWDLVVDCIAFKPANAEQDVALFKNRTKQFAFISTDFVFDPFKRSSPLTEECSHFLKEGYGGDKRKCEEILINTNPDQLHWTVFRPNHIYGPGSRLGCLPKHGRDPDLICKMQAGETLCLVEGGRLLQQPIYVDDLAKTILSMIGNQKVAGKFFNVAGPDKIESRRYYEIIAEVLRVPVIFSEISIEEFLKEKPDQSSYCCHRTFDLKALKESGLNIPNTPIEMGLKRQVESLLLNPKLA